MTKFRVYYGEWNGEMRFVDSDDCSPQDVPALGVQAIVQEHPYVGWEIVSHKDYFVWRDDRWWAVDFAGLIDYFTRPGWKAVLVGRMLSMEAFTKIFAHANNERGFANKNGFLPQEVRPE